MIRGPSIAIEGPFFEFNLYPLTPVAFVIFFHVLVS